MSKFSNIKAYLQIYGRQTAQAEDTLGFMVRHPSNLGRTVDNLNDEVRQITLHYENVLGVVDKIKEIKVLTASCVEDPGRT